MADKLKEFMEEFASMKRVVKAAENYVAARRAFVVAADKICDAETRMDKAYDILAERVAEFQKAFGHPADQTDLADQTDGRAA